MVLAPLARGSSSLTAAGRKASCQDIVSSTTERQDLPLTEREEVGGETVKVVTRYNPTVLKGCNVAERW